MANFKHKKILRIFVKNPHIKSRAAYIKLKRKLKLLDPTENYKVNYHFRRTYLEKRLEKDGELVCEYCGKRDLILEPEGLTKKLTTTMLATIDHVRAKVNGGSKFDENNIKISCPTCNNKKADMSEEAFLQQLEVSS